MAYIGKQPVVGNFQVCDAISVVNGQAAYTMQVSSTNVEPENANHMLVSLNGVLQKPGSSFTISGATLTFASNLATGDVIDFIILLGDTLNIGAPSDDTVTAAKLATTSITGHTAETSIADGDTILIHDASASALRKMTKANFVSGIGGSNTPMASVDKTGGSQSISASTHTKITLNSERADSDGAFTSNTFTVPSGQAGKYLLIAYGRLDALNGSSDYGQIQIANSDRSAQYATGLQSGKTGYGFENMSCQVIKNFSVGDTVSLYCYSTEAVSVAEDNCNLTIIKLIE